MGVGTVAAQAIVKNLIFVDDRFLELYLFSFTLFSTMVRPWSQKRSNLLLSSWYYLLQMIWWIISVLKMNRAFYTYAYICIMVIGM